MAEISFYDIINPLMNGVSAVFGWFQEYILVGDWGILIIGLVIFSLFARLILAPLFGASIRSGISDSIRESHHLGDPSTEGQVKEVKK